MASSGFNLTAFVLDNGTIKVQTLDSFYALPSSGSPFDISSFIDVSKSQVNVALPYREIIFEYKGLGTKLALQHEQLTTGGVGWGTTEYMGDANRVEVTIMDNEWHRQTEIIQFSGATGQGTFVVPFDPVEVFIDLEEKY